MCSTYTTLVCASVGAVFAVACGNDERSGGDTPVCGDQVVEAPEACEPTNLLGHACVDFGFNGGALACAANCRAFDTSACAPGVCGDGALDAGELCDGANLNGITCERMGFGAGTIACGDDCMRFDLSGCAARPVPAHCGDALLQAHEFCDGPQWLAGPGCFTYAMGNGDATCTASCSVDMSSCQRSDLCAANGWYNDDICDYCDLMGGTIDPDCTNLCPAADGTCWDYYNRPGQAWLCRHLGYVDPDCGVCGNNVVEGGEFCDGSDLGAYDCVGLGFLGAGTVACAPDCTYDVSGCIVPTCSNEILEGPEPCDGNNLDGLDCSAFGFGSGTLACATDCASFDTSGCTNPVCGNGIIDVAARYIEVCEAGELGGFTCERLGLGPGTLACMSSCRAFDVSGCGAQSAASSCGDGSLQGLEECDGSQWRFGPACAAFGLGSGDVTCSSLCSDDVASCERSDVCAALGWYGDNFCDACELLGGTVDADCTSLCPVFDGICWDYYDKLTQVWSCRHLGLIDPDCGVCGNDLVENGEYCDGSSISDSCGDFNFSGGTLACTGDCRPDFAGCVP